jgi:hypothetical protein
MSQPLTDFGAHETDMEGLARTRKRLLLASTQGKKIEAEVIAKGRSASSVMGRQEYNALLATRVRMLEWENKALRAHIRKLVAATALAESSATPTPPS